MWSAIAGAVTGGLLNAGSSAMNAGIQYGTSKALAKYNYELGQRSLRNSPKNYKQGLIDAGINPILASDSPVGSTQGSSGINPDFDIGGDAVKGFSAKMLKDQTKSNVELQGKQGDAALKNAEANKTQAEAAKKNADTNEKMLAIGGVNAGANAVGTLGKLYTAGNTVVMPSGGSVPKTVTSAKGMKGATTVPSATSAKAIPSAATVISVPAAAALGTAGVAYGVGKYMESKGYGKIVDKGPNKNELRHRTGGLGNSSTKTKTSKRRHN